VLAASIDPAIASVTIAVEEGRVLPLACSDLASTSHRGGASRRLERLAALGAVPLDGRSPLNDWMASSALEQGDLHPLARSAGERDRDFALGDAQPMQYAAGSRPPEPTAY
jgi:hypothetical protein